MGADTAFAENLANAICQYGDILKKEAVTPPPCHLAGQCQAVGAQHFGLDTPTEM